MSNTLTLDLSGVGGCEPDQDPWEPDAANTGAPKPVSSMA